MNLFRIIALAAFLPLMANGAPFPYVTLNGKTNRLSDNGTAFTRNGVAIGGGSSSTNWVASISALVATANTTTPVYVYSYYGTNDLTGNPWGGGWFTYDASSTTATNYGTVFTAAPGGRWLRVVPSASVFYLEWFGVVNSWQDSSTFIDSTVQIQNCIDTAPNRSVIYWPRMCLSSSEVIISNRVGLTIKAVDFTHGSPRNGFADGPSLCYCGTGTNGPVVAIHNSSSIIWDGIYVSTETATYPTQVNHANVGISVDEPGNTGDLTTEITIQNCVIAGRSTNSNWIGLDISKDSGSNVEQCKVENVGFIGGYDGGDWTKNALDGTAIRLGVNNNAFQWVFRHVNWQHCNTGVLMLGSHAVFDDIYGGNALIDFDLRAWSGPVSINNVRSEGAKQAIKMRGGVAGVEVTNSRWDEGDDPGTTPLFYLDTSANEAQLTIGNCEFGGIATRVMFGATNTVANSRLTSRNNQYFNIPYYNVNYSVFSYWVSENDHVGPVYFALSSTNAVFASVIITNALTLTNSTFTINGHPVAVATNTSSAGYLLSATDGTGTNGAWISPGSVATSSVTITNGTSGVVPLTINQTSAGSANLINATVGGVNQFFVDKNGEVVTLGGYLMANSQVDIGYNSANVSLDKNYAVQWSSTTISTGPKDLVLTRAFPGVLSIQGASSAAGVMTNLSTVYFGTNALSFNGTDLTWNGTAITVP